MLFECFVVCVFVCLFRPFFLLCVFCAFLFGLEGCLFLGGLFFVWRFDFLLDFFLVKCGNVKILGTGVVF